MNTNKSALKYKTNSSVLIIKEPSVTLLAAEEIALETKIESIQPDAQFLFTKIQRLFLNSNYGSIKEIVHTIDMFEAINTRNNTIDFIEIHLKDIEKKSEAELGLLTDYRIQKLTIHGFKRGSLDTFHRMKGIMNFVTELHLHSCKFDKLEHTVFGFCAPTLVKLDLSNVSVTVSAKSPFKQLRRLKELNLSGCQLSHVDFNLEFVEGLDKLKSLDISKTKLKSMKKAGLAFLRNLETLHLKNIPFDKIGSGAFDSLSYLTTLDLTFCKLDSLKTDSFESLFQLQILNLSNNTIRDIDPGAFNGLTELFTLDLSCNQLKKLKEGIFEGLESLTELNLQKNKVLCDVDPGAFIGLSSLKRLDLSCSSIREIKSNIFSPLTELVNLDLRNCGIESIDLAAFDKLAEIDSINLSNNKLVTFKTKSTPRTLNLAANKSLSSIRLTGRYYARIEEINLEQNETRLVDFNSMFGQNNQVNVQRLKMTLEALGTDSLFSHMKCLTALTITQLSKNSAVQLSSNSFHGLNNLESLKMCFKLGSSFSDEPPQNGNF